MLTFMIDRSFDTQILLEEKFMVLESLFPERNIHAETENTFTITCKTHTHTATFIDEGGTLTRVEVVRHPAEAEEPASLIKDLLDMFTPKMGKEKVTSFDTLVDHLGKVGILVTSEGFERYLSWPKVSQLADDNVGESGMSDLIPFETDGDGILDLLTEHTPGGLHMHLPDHTYDQAVAIIGSYLSSIYFGESIGNKLANM